MVFETLDSVLVRFLSAGRHIKPLPNPSKGKVIQILDTIDFSALFMCFRAKQRKVEVSISESAP